MLKRALKQLKELGNFVRQVAADERIPPRDKKILLALVALIISPLDIIPDWIPVIGVMDDLVLGAIVLDYLFNVLDEEILLAHWPWDMKAYARLRRGARFVARFTPRWATRRIWKFQGSPYRKASAGR